MDVACVTRIAWSHGQLGVLERVHLLVEFLRERGVVHQEQRIARAAAVRHRQRGGLALDVFFGDELHRIDDDVVLRALRADDDIHAPAFLEMETPHRLEQAADRWLLRLIKEDLMHAIEGLDGDGHALVAVGLCRIREAHLVDAGFR